MRRILRKSGRALSLALAVGALMFSTRLAVAGNFPDRAIHFLVAAAPASGPDQIARYFAQRLSFEAKQKIDVTNIAGAEGADLDRFMSRAAPQGYTLLFDSNVDLAADPTMMRAAEAAPLRAVAACAQMASVLTVPPSAPLKTVHDLVVKLEAKNGGAFGYVSQDSLLAGQLFNDANHTRAVPVGYASLAAAANKIEDGTLDFMIMDAPAALAEIHKRNVKALAVTGKWRLRALPDTPTMSEAGEAHFIFAPRWDVFASKDAPKTALQRLKTWLSRIEASSRTADFLEARDATPARDDASSAPSRIFDASSGWAALLKQAAARAQ